MLWVELQPVLCLVYAASIGSTKMTDALFSTIYAGKWTKQGPLSHHTTLFRWDIQMSLIRVARIWNRKRCLIGGEC